MCGLLAVTGWGVAAKVPLLMPKSLSEPLVRGRRLDGSPEPLGFSGGHGRPYRTFSHTIVFRVAFLTAASRKSLRANCAVFPLRPLV